jgi:hypothetical protein
MLETEPLPAGSGCAGEKREGPGPLKLHLLKYKIEKRRCFYDVAGVDPAVIKNYLEGSEGDRYEWIGDELVTTSESSTKRDVGIWVHDLSCALRRAGWVFCSNLHAVGGDGRWFLPNNTAYLNPQIVCCNTETHYPLQENPLPQFAVEVERASEIDEAGQGFCRANQLFALEGHDNTHIEEVWVINIPDGVKPRANPRTTPPIISLPRDQHPLAMPITERPPPTVFFLALLTRAVPPQQGGVVRAYYVLQANEIFRAPEYSVLSVPGPMGPRGAPGLPANDLFLSMGFRVIGWP